MAAITVCEAPQGTALDPFLFTCYTDAFNHNSASGHSHKLFDDYVVGRIVDESRH